MLFWEEDIYEKKNNKKTNIISSQRRSHPEETSICPPFMKIF